MKMKPFVKIQLKAKQTGVEVNGHISYGGGEEYLNISLEHSET